MTERDAGIGRKLINKRMIMSWEQRATLDTVAQLAYYSTGDGVAVVRRCTTTCNIWTSITSTSFRMSLCV